MKKHINLLNALILALLLLPAFSFADDDIDKKRTISKSYTVTSSDKLSIENSFGNVVVATWDKNEIKVDIEIGVRASSDQKAQEMMDEIEVRDSRNGNTIAFKTDIGDINERGNNRKRNRNEDHPNRDGDNDGERKFYIDYKVYMPAVNPLNIENSFGKTTVPDLTGEVNLTSKFGSLTTGKLDNVDEIDVEFGTASLGPVHNGEITFKFNGKSHIASVSGNVKIKSEFSGNVQFDVDNNIEELSIYESYSTIKMQVTKALSANFDVHTSFGSFHNNTDFRISEQKEDDDNGPRFDHDYSGKAGDGKARIKIKSSFGNVRVSDNNNNSSSKDDEDDDKEEKRSSKKSKTSI
ncbi:MAG: hypothetical protein JST75_16535 [Bacteroidetes bacterium]|nr:hypothetical protein [Bacteroidota bacterium]